MNINIRQNSILNDINNNNKINLLTYKKGITALISSTVVGGNVWYHYSKATYYMKQIFDAYANDMSSGLNALPSLFSLLNSSPMQFEKVFNIPRFVLQSFSNNLLSIITFGNYSGSKITIDDIKEELAITDKIMNKSEFSITGSIYNIGKKIGKRIGHLAGSDISTKHINNLIDNVLLHSERIGEMFALVLMTVLLFCILIFIKNKYQKYQNTKKIKSFISSRRKSSSSSRKKLAASALLELSKTRKSRDGKYILVRRRI